MPRLMEINYPPPEIFTPRLRLRELLISDAAAVFQLRSNDGVQKWTVGGKIWQSIKEAEDWATSRPHTLPFTFKYAIEIRDRGAIGENNNDSIRDSNSNMEHIPNLIGTVGATTSILQIGYMLDPAHHGQGLATEALTAFLPVFFECLPQIDYCEAWVNGANVKSLRVLEKCGFLPKTPNPRGTWEEGNAKPEENEIEEMAISNLDEAVENELRLAIEDMNLTVGKVYKAPLRKPMVGYELRKDNFTPKDEITKEKED